MKSITRYIYTGIGAMVTIQSALAQIDIGEKNVPAGWKGTAEGKPLDTIQNFITGLLSFLGVIMVGVTLWGGWKILTSGSEDEGKEAGKKIIINAVIGIVIIFFAWTLTSLVFSVLAGGGKVN